MSFNFEQPYDEVFSQSDDANHHRPIPKRKTISQQVAFWGTNALVMPFIGICYLTVSAEGLRQMMSVFSMRLYKLPVPGAGILKNYDGWDRLDLSTIMALLLFGAVTYIWYRLFAELMGSTDLLRTKERNPILFYLVAAILVIMLLGDCAIFYYGLESKTSAGWGNTPEYVPLVATVIYMAGLALIGAWHADYHNSDVV